MKSLPVGPHFLLHVDPRQYAERCWMPWVRIEDRRTGESAVVALPAPEVTRRAAGAAAIREALGRIRAGSWRD
jgi:hypothetical protein